MDVEIAAEDDLEDLREFGALRQLGALSVVTIRFSSWRSAWVVAVKSSTVKWGVRRLSLTGPPWRAERRTLGPR